jgi:metal-responsive CopG/Arc/MetJ family transcriptional regulator
MSALQKRPANRKVTIKIPGTLYNRLVETIAESGFNSVTEFIVYVLRDLVSTKGQVKETKQADESSLTADEIESIRKRLKSLGYLS